MKSINTLSAIVLVMILSACSSMNKPYHKFTYFHADEQFNIASLGLYKVGVIALIDDTKTLDGETKRTLTNDVYRIFAKRVDGENLIDTEELATHLGIEKYQRIQQAAKKNLLSQVSELYNQADTQPARYLLLVRLTDSRDLGKDVHHSNDVFFASNDCANYGWALGLTMTIIDTSTSREVWGGHLNKDNKSQYCEDDDDFYDDDSSDKANGESLLAALAIMLVVSAIVDEANDDEASLTKIGLKPLFTEAVSDFAHELPSIYFR